MKKNLIYLSRLGLIAFFLSVGSAGSARATNHGLELSKRRAGVVSMRPLNNKVKALATTDFSGWTYFSDLLIGSYSPQWLAAYSYGKGQYQWFVPTKAELAIPPVVFGGSMVLAFRDGMLEKIDPLTGKTAWSISLDSYANRNISMVGNTLLVGTASQILYAVDFQSGKTEWLYDAGFPEGLIVAAQPSPVSKNGIVYFGLTNGELAAIELKSGTELWRFNPIYSESRFKDIVGEVASHQNRLLVTRYDGFVGLLTIGDSSTKVEIVWRQLIGSITTSLYKDGRYFVATVSGDLYCYDADSGSQLWKLSLGDSIGRMMTDENNIYFAGNTGLVGAVDFRKGSLIWYDELAARFSTPPLFVDDKILFFSGLKNIYSYSL